MVLRCTMKKGMAEVMCPTKYGDATLTACGAISLIRQVMTSASFFSGSSLMSVRM